jgi:hypothetical protein
MAAGDLSDVLATTKVNYDKKIKDLMPGECVIQEMTDFCKKDFSALGRSFNFPWLVKNEWGYTALGTTGASASLNAAVNGVYEEAAVKPYESWFNGRLTFTAAQRGSEAGKKAFESLATLKMKNVREMHRKVTEIKLLHGCADIGTVKSFSVDTITLNARTSSPALLGLLPGAVLDIKQSDGTTDRTNAVDLTVASVDVSSSAYEYTITFSAITGTPVSGDRVFLNAGSSSLTGSEMPGLMRLGAVTSGTLWGLTNAATTYSLLRANTKASFGLATVAKLLKEQVRNVNNGGSGEYWMILHPDVYQSLANDESAKQMFDSSYKENELKSGAKSLRLYSTSGSQIVLLAHPFQKEGSIGVFAKDNIQRIGSSDHTMEVGGQELLRWVTGTNYFDLADFTDQCVVLDKPAQNLTITGVTVA